MYETRNIAHIGTIQALCERASCGVCGVGINMAIPNFRGLDRRGAST